MPGSEEFEVIAGNHYRARSIKIPHDTVRELARSKDRETIHKNLRKEKQRKFIRYVSPLATAVFFTIIVIFMDVFVVALLIERSFTMFGSLLGAWISFALVFTTWSSSGSSEQGSNGRFLTEAAFQ